MLLLFLFSSVASRELSERDDQILNLENRLNMVYFYYIIKKFYMHSTKRKKLNNYCA